MVPGPIIVLTVTRSITDNLGNRAPLALLALEGALGDTLALGVCLAGLGALLRTWHEAFTAVQLLAACYIMRVGLAPLIPREPSKAPIEESQRTPQAQEFLLAALHPASVVFFAAYTPVFIDPNRDLLPQFAAMASSFILPGLGSVVIWAVLPMCAKSDALSIGLRAAIAAFLGSR